MRDDTARLPPEPTPAQEGRLRAAGAWPIGRDGRVRDPGSGERWRWWRVAELLLRDAFDAAAADGEALDGPEGE